MNANLQTSVNTREKDYIQRGPVLSGNFIKGILSRIDIVDIVGNEFALRVKKEGKNSTLRKRTKKGFSDYISLCPFHSELSPSFLVLPGKQFYYCFGCGVSGDAIKFLEEYRGISKLNAIKYLAKKAGVKIKYGNFYKEDYFAKYDQLLEGKRDFIEGIRYPSYIDGASEVGEFENEYSLKRIALLKNAISTILEAQDRKYDELFGKSVTEILGEDPDRENNELTEIQVGYTLFDAESFITDVEIEDEEERIELEEKLAHERKSRLLELKHNIRSRIHALHEEKLQRERLKQEKERMAIFLQKQNQAASDLYGNTISYDTSMQTFFNQVNYRTLLGKESFLPGAMGKFVCIYSENVGFSCIFGDKRFLAELPNSFEKLSATLATKNMADAGIFHKGIQIPKNAIRLGGAQFLVLEKNTVIVSGQSGDFFQVPHEVVKKCLDVLNYRVIFLSNAPTLTQAQVYETIQRKAGKIGNN